MREERSGNGTHWEKRGAGMEHTWRREEREWNTMGEERSGNGTHLEKRGAGIEHYGRREERE